MRPQGSYPVSSALRTCSVPTDSVQLFLSICVSQLWPIGATKHKTTDSSSCKAFLLDCIRASCASIESDARASVGYAPSLDVLQFFDDSGVCDLTCARHSGQASLRACNSLARVAWHFLVLWYGQDVASLCTADRANLSDAGEKRNCPCVAVGGLQRCVESFSRMRSRRVLVLRLVVWGLGVDAKSVRSVRKRPRCVRKRSRCVRKRSRRKLSRSAELSCWTRVGSSRLSSVNSHRGRGGPGRETQN